MKTSAANIFNHYPTLVQSLTAIWALWRIAVSSVTILPLLWIKGHDPHLLWKSQVYEIPFIGSLNWLWDFLTCYKILHDYAYCSQMLGFDPDYDIESHLSDEKIYSEFTRTDCLSITRYQVELYLYIDHIYVILMQKCKHIACIASSALTNLGFFSLPQWYIFHPIFHELEIGIN